MEFQFKSTEHDFQGRAGMVIARIPLNEKHVELFYVPAYAFEWYGAFIRCSEYVIKKFYVNDNWPVEVKNKYANSFAYGEKNSTVVLIPLSQISIMKECETAPTWVNINEVDIKKQIEEKAKDDYVLQKVRI